MIKAVITGDIVQSTKLKVEEKTWLIKNLQKILKQWDKDFGTRSEIFRGDSFQCLIEEPKNALRFALLIRTYLRSLNPSEAYDIYTKKQRETVKTVMYTQWLFDTRMAIGIGEVDPPMNKVLLSDGEAFQLSGRKLDTLKNGRQMLAIKTTDGNEPELSTEIILLDYIVSKATALQCEVINQKLLGYTEIEISKNLKIGQSAVNQRSVSSGWNVIQVALERYEEIYDKPGVINLAELFKNNI